MPKPPQLAPFSVKEQQLYPLVPFVCPAFACPEEGAKTPTAGNSLQPLVSMISIGHYLNLTTIGEDKGCQRIFLIQICFPIVKNCES